MKKLFALLLAALFTVSVAAQEGTTTGTVQGQSTTNSAKKKEAKPKKAKTAKAEKPKKEKKAKKDAQEPPK